MTAAISLGVEGFAGGLGACFFCGAGAACKDKAATPTTKTIMSAAAIVLEAFIVPPVELISFTSARL
jgi:hypothetical protein